LSSISPRKLEKLTEGTLSGLGFKVSRQEFVRSSDGVPVGFDMVARRPDGDIAYIDLLPSDRVTVSDIITTLSGSPHLAEVTAGITAAGSSGTFIVTEGRIDTMAKEKADEFGVRIVRLAELRQALAAQRVTIPHVQSGEDRSPKGSQRVRRYLRRSQK